MEDVNVKINRLGIVVEHDVNIEDGIIISNKIIDNGEINRRYYRVFCPVHVKHENQEFFITENGYEIEIMKWRNQKRK